jgi:hypothetical protein
VITFTSQYKSTDLLHPGSPASKYTVRALKPVCAELLGCAHSFFSVPPSCPYTGVCYIMTYIQKASLAFKTCALNQCALNPGLHAYSFSVPSFSLNTCVLHSLSCFTFSVPFLCTYTGARQNIKLCVVSFYNCAHSFGVRFSCTNLMCAEPNQQTCYFNSPTYK